MRLTVTGEWDPNRLLQVVVPDCFFGILLWCTNWMLYFEDMGLAAASVAEHYLDDEEEFRAPRSYRGMVELVHLHLFAMGMLMMVPTHLALWSVFAGSQAANYSGADAEGTDDEEWD